MKHGQKSEKKAAKTVKKASSPKSGKKAATPKSRSKAPKTVKKASSAQSGKKTAAPRSASPARKGEAISRPAPSGRAKAPVAITFTNAAVAAGFKRAVKKYPNALRRLSD
jgi:hypothetical protein